MWLLYVLWVCCPAACACLCLCAYCFRPRGCFLQNAAGKFIDVKGNLASGGVKTCAGRPLCKTLRPMSEAMAIKEGCPDSIFARDGESLATYYFKPMSKQLKRPISIVNSDGEIFISLMSPAEYFNFSLDPKVDADFKASALPNWETYWSRWRARLNNAFSNAFLQDPALKDKLFKNAAYTMYQVQGSNAFFGNWTETRKIMTPMHNAQTGKQTYYSTEDIYSPTPHEWLAGGGPDHAVRWTVQTRYSELASGDTLMSPFVAAGWSGTAEKNTRPAQWLGLLKLLAAWGAEWFYAGFFSLHQPFQPSQNWCWQAVMPPMAQAVTTQVAEFLYKGKLLAADANTTYVDGDTADCCDGERKYNSALLWTGAPHVLAIARKLDHADAYLITMAVQKWSNAEANLEGTAGSQVYTPVSGLYLPGLERPVEGLVARQQGSVYVWRNDSGTGNSTLYQVDGWHEATHPLYWQRDAFALEAELFRGHLTAKSSAIVTERHDAFDPTNWTTFVDLKRASSGVSYELSRHALGAKRRLRMRMRSGRATVHIGGERHDLSASGSEWQMHEMRWTPGAESAAELVLSGTAHVDAIQIV